MSSGSTFTLYRKYNDKATTAQIADIIAKYVKTNRENDYSQNKKADEKYAEDVPLILNPHHGFKESEYDKVTKTWKDMRDHSIEGQRENFKYVLKSDGSHLDKLLEWNFCSSFTCLKTEWNLCNDNYKNNMHLIDEFVAEQMLQACNYLLSGKWSDEFENILNNHWINVFADGNECCSYWKYLYRKTKKKLNDLIDENNEVDEVEWQLKRVKAVLDTFLGVDKDYGENPNELILVYSAW